MSSRRLVQIEPLDPSLLRALARPDAHPADPEVSRAPITHVQTHLSHVFLTHSRVYKLHKAVDLGFVCFATRAQRNRDSLRELRLNRRLSPDVYLGLAPLLPTGDGRPARRPIWRVGPLRNSLARDARGRPYEHVVVMRRLPAGRDLRTLLDRGRARPDQIDAIARRVAEFHAASRLSHPVRTTPETWLACVRRPILDNVTSLGESARRSAELARVVSARRLDALRATTEAALHRLAPVLVQRLRERRPVDGHGDLHLEHVWFEADDAQPLLIDCLEFRDDLRRIDPASEVAFLAMDLAYRGERRLAERFLRRYAEAADDFGLYALVDLFVSYRAAVRAKVAAVAACDEAIPQAQRRAAIASVKRHLALGSRALRQRVPGAVVLTCGVVGTGKSSVARALGDALDAPVIATDRVRKSGARHRPVYASRARNAVYDALLARAACVVDAGRCVVLDATFDTASRRAKVLRFARARAAPVFLVETRCAPAITRARLAARLAAGGDPSDAGPAFHAVHAARFHAPIEWPREQRAVVHTDVPWRTAVRAIAARWRKTLRRRV